MCFIFVLLSSFWRAFRLKPPPLFFPATALSFPLLEVRWVCLSVCPAVSIFFCVLTSVSSIPFCLSVSRCHAAFHLEACHLNFERGWQSGNRPLALGIVVSLSLRDSSSQLLLIIPPFPGLLRNHREHCYVDPLGPATPAQKHGMILLLNNKDCHRSSTPQLLASICMESRHKKRSLVVVAVDVVGVL